MLFAGTDITSIALTFSFYYLSLYPDLLKELRDEIQRAIPNGKITTISQLNSLESMHSTLKEVLRLHPPVPFIVKEAVRDTQILDLRLKKGDIAGISILAHNTMVSRN